MVHIGGKSGGLATTYCSCSSTVSVQALLSAPLPLLCAPVAEHIRKYADCIHHALVWLKTNINELLLSTAEKDPGFLCRSDASIPDMQRGVWVVPCLANQINQVIRIICIVIVSKYIKIYQIISTYIIYSVADSSPTYPLTRPLNKDSRKCVPEKA